MRLLQYFATLRAGKIVLWCYLLWYIVTAAALFDPSPSIWLNSAGISLVIGVALLLSVSNAAEASTNTWQTFRLFLMPFCVSSFSSLIKGQGYILIFPNRLAVLIASVVTCIVFVTFVLCLKLLFRSNAGGPKRSGGA